MLVTPWQGSWLGAPSVLEGGASSAQAYESALPQRFALLHLHLVMRMKLDSAQVASRAAL